MSPEFFFPENITSQSSHSRKERKEDEVPTIISRAEEKDLAKILAWDEEAKLTSTGKGYTEKQRAERMKFFEKALDSRQYAVFTLKTNPHDAPYGFVILDGSPEPENDFESLGETFTEFPDTKPLSKKEVLDYFANKRPKQARFHVASMTVDKSLRGKGIGGRALKQLAEQIQGPQKMIVTFETGVKNMAVRKAIKGATFLEVTLPNSAYAESRLIGVIEIPPKQPNAAP